MADGNQRMSMRAQQYRLNRQKFACKVYCIAALFVVLTMLQWLPIVLTTVFNDFYTDFFFVSMIFLLLALLCITLFVFLERIRFLLPLNVLMCLLIVEFVTFGLGRILIWASAELYGICFVIVLVVVMIFILIGIIMVHDLTLDVVILFLCSIIFFIGSVFFVALHIISSISYSIYVYCSFVIAAVLAFIMYHAQTINGSRYAEMRLNDYWLAALIIYHDFIILYAVVFYIMSSVWGHPEAKTVV